MSAWIAVGAIYYETDLPEEEQQHLVDNAAFFSETLPGRHGPLGSPGGADRLGPVGRADRRPRGHRLQDRVTPPTIDPHDEVRCGQQGFITGPVDHSATV